MLPTEEVSWPGISCSCCCQTQFLPHLQAEVRDFWAYGTSSAVPDVGHGAFAIQEVQEPPESTLLACPLSFLSVTASHLLQADEACTIKDETIPENPILP